MIEEWGYKELMKMLFKEFMWNLKVSIKEYQKRLEFLENEKTNPYEEGVLTKFEKEFYTVGTTTVYDFFYYYKLEIIREYIGKVIAKIVENDSRYDEYLSWYFDLDNEPKLKKELMEKFFKTDENIFDDEVLRVVFKIILWNAQDRKNDNCDYEDITCFDDDVMLEFFYLAVKKNEKLIEEFREEYKMYVNYREENKVDWEKLL